MNLGSLTVQFRSLVDKLKKMATPVLKHHVIIAVMIVAGVMIYAVTVVNQVLDEPTDTAYLDERTQESINTQFSSDTIERIERLRNRLQNANLNLPGGRISPFVE